MFRATIKSRIGEDISIMVKVDNHPWNYICECGDASDLTMKEVQQANAIFISHAHIDHFVNFDTMIRHQIGVQRRIIICGSKGMAGQVQARIKSYTWNLIEKGAITYEIRELVRDQEIKVFEMEPPMWELKEVSALQSNVLLKEKGFQVTGVLLDHKTPSLAYKFQEEDTVKIDIKACGFKGGEWIRVLKSAFENKQGGEVIQIEGKDYKASELFHLLHVQEGDSVGIIMDHAANEENHKKIIDHFSGSRQVLIESFFKEEDKALAEQNYHSYTYMSGKVMREAGVKEAIPVHFSRKYKQEDIDVLTKEFEEAFGLV